MGFDIETIFDINKECCDENKYVNYGEVKELLELMETRNQFNDWSKSYEKYDIEVKKATSKLNENVITINI